MATARDRTVAFFETRVVDVDPGWANLFGYLHRRFGLELRTASGLALHEVPDGGQRPALAAVYRRLVDPDAEIEAAAIAALPTVVDRITASALHCGRIPLPSNWLEVLRRAGETGGYALTHAALAAQWTLENGCVDPLTLAPVQTAIVDRLVDLASRRDGLAREFETPTDLWIESLAMLHYLGAESRVERVWIDQLVRLQRPDGGFSARPDRERSDAHASALALWVLLEELSPQLPPSRWIPAR